MSEVLYNKIEQLSLDKFLEELFQGQALSPFSKLRPFQKQVLRIANANYHTVVAAPSQSGKSTCNIGFLIPVLFKKNGDALLVTNSGDNAEELYEDFVRYVIGNQELDKALHKHGIEQRGRLGVPSKVLTKVATKKKGELIATSAMGSTFRFVTATEGAVAGKSPDRIVLDEVAIWDKSQAHKVYAEVLARIGNSQGRILCQSTVRESGTFKLLPDGDFQLKGNIFYSYLTKHLYQQVHGQRKGIDAALCYTYHASELLKEVLS